MKATCVGTVFVVQGAGGWENWNVDMVRCEARVICTDMRGETCEGAVGYVYGPQDAGLRIVALRDANGLQATGVDVEILARFCTGRHEPPA